MNGKEQLDLIEETETRRIAAVRIHVERAIARVKSFRILKTLLPINGNHKLIRWHLVFHGGIDGYTRMIVFLACSNNNRAETVFTSCHGAVQQFGLPSRIRSDKGKENLDGSNDTDFAYSSNVFSRSRKNRTDVSRTRERPPSVSQASINL
eukprot:gene12584-13872_t